MRDAIAGDEAAWSGVIVRFDGLVRHVVRAHGIDPAAVDDVVQTTWCLLIQNLHRIREPDRLGAWLARTARNESLKALRVRSRETPVEESELRAFLGDVERYEVEDVDTAELRKLVMRAFETLDDDERDFLRLVLLGEPRPSYQQIGATIGRPVGSIGPTLGRCLDKLRRATLSLSEVDPATRHLAGGRRVGRRMYQIEQNAIMAYVEEDRAAGNLDGRATESSSAISSAVSASSH